MKKILTLVALTVLLPACDNQSNSTPDGSTSIESTSSESSTKLSHNTLYYYNSAFLEFKERLQWIANTDPNHLRAEAAKARETKLRTKDMVQNILSISMSLQGMPFVPLARPRDDAGKPTLPWWCDPTGNLSDSPIENTFERTIRSLPKLEEDGVWIVQDIESYEFEFNDPAKAIFDAMADYNMQGAGKTKQAQPQARVVASASALIFRESDSSLLFINGMKWNHPLYSEGYTEFHLHISLKTGAVINDTYAYTTFPLEPGVFTQYANITKNAIEAVKLAKSLMGK